MPIAQLLSLDVRALVRIRGLEAVEPLRTSIRHFIWPEGRKIHPIDKQSDAHFSSIQSVRWAQQWTFTMENGVTSHAFFLKSAGNGACLFIYHEGHEPKPIFDVAPVREIANAFTGRGCDVILLSMPLVGVNAQNEILINGTLRPIKSDGLHNSLAVLESKTFSPFSYFIDPVVQSLDEALSQSKYNRVGMSV